MSRSHHIFLVLMSSLCQLRQKISLIISRQRQKKELPLMDTARLAIPHQTSELLNRVFCSSGSMCQRSAVFPLKDDSPDYSFLQWSLFSFFLFPLEPIYIISLQQPYKSYSNESTKWKLSFELTMKTSMHENEFSILEKLKIHYTV